MEDDDGEKLGMTPAELALELGLQPSEAEQMAWTAWRGGQLQFDIIGRDLVFRLVATT